MFITLAGLGGVLLIAYAVAGTQILTALQPMVMKSADNDPDGLVLLLRSTLSLPPASAAVALGGAVGTGCAVALIDAPLHSTHWWLMGLTGVSIFTIALLALAVAISVWLASYLTLADHKNRPGDGSDS